MAKGSTSSSGRSGTGRSLIGVVGNCPIQEAMVLFVLWDVGGSGNVMS